LHDFEPIEVRGVPIDECGVGLIRFEEYRVGVVWILGGIFGFFWVTQDDGEVRRLRCLIERGDGEQGGSVVGVCDSQPLVPVPIRALPRVSVDVECAQPGRGAGHPPDRDQEDMDAEGSGVVRERPLVRAHGVAVPAGASRHGGEAHGRGRSQAPGRSLGGRGVDLSPPRGRTEAQPLAILLPPCLRLHRVSAPARVCEAIRGRQRQFRYE
jgi:hypothetical protein